MAPDRVFFASGAVLALLAVAAGAFAAHGLKARFGTDMLATFELAARYQMYHAVARRARRLPACRRRAWP